MLDFDTILLPIYIINLKDRPDRLAHVMKEFDGKAEFEIHVIEAISHKIGAVGLWKTIRQCVQSGLDSEDDFIILCEDDHIFTEHYQRDLFIQNILEAHAQHCDILSGGIAGFNHAVPLNANRYWIDHFWCTQFIVIFRKFFEILLNESYTDTVTADDKLSEITSNKMVLYPFISIQKEFGYSDVTTHNNTNSGKLTEKFAHAENRLSVYKRVFEKYIANP